MAFFYIARGRGIYWKNKQPVFAYNLYCFMRSFRAVDNKINRKTVSSIEEKDRALNEENINNQLILINQS